MHRILPNMLITLRNIHEIFYFFSGDYERHMEYEHDEEPSNIPSSPEPEKQVQI